MTELTVWFDGACTLCRREIAFLSRLDRARRIAFVDVSAGAPESCPIDRADLLARFHAQPANGPIVSGAAAFAAMWRVIPILKPIGLAATWPPMMRLLEMAYIAWLRLRPSLQRIFR